MYNNLVVQTTPPRPRLLGFPFHILSLALLILGSLLSVLSSQQMSVTYDEPAHFRYGWQICAQGNAQRFTDGTMPISCWNVLPRLFGLRAADEAGNIHNGRYMTIVFTLLLGWLVRRWSSELYGDKAGFFSTLLFVFCPNILANAGLVTTDMYAAGWLTFSMYTLWKFTRYGGWQYALASLISLAFAQLTKYSLIFIYPVWILLLAGSAWNYHRHHQPNPALPGWRSTLAYMGAGVIISLLVINAGFLFSGSGTPLKKYELRSNAFKSIRNSLDGLAKIPLPLPYPFLDGLDWGELRNESGTGYGNIYLLGQIIETLPGYHGFPGYYLVASLYKIPLPSLAILLLALIRLGKRSNRDSFLTNEFFLLLPVLVYGIYMNYFYDRQIGLRHFILVFPLLHIFGGSLFQNINDFSRPRQLAAGGLCLYLILSVLSYHPNYLAYFNELVPDRKYAYKILVDSNLDWGQSQDELNSYLKSHPEALLNPKQPVEGLVVVSANLLVGVVDPEDYRWLRERCEPIRHVGYAYLVFDTSPNSTTCQY